jgi:hypothetical protein
LLHGCQLSLLDCEDELLAVAGEMEIAKFLEASRAVVKGPHDLSLVEGSITTPRDAKRIHQIRHVSKTASNNRSVRISSSKSSRFPGMLVRIGKESGLRPGKF